MSGVAASMETRASWVAAAAALAVMSVVFGTPYVAVVALKDIARDVGGERSVPALCYSLAWLGTAVGGVAMGRIAERVGVRATTIWGSVMVVVGLFIAASGGEWSLFIGHGIFIGVLGLGGINAPVYVYVSRWFDHHRGTALALISSGLYVAGAAWPPLFQEVIARVGWRETMMIFAGVQAVVVVPVAWFFFDPPPREIAAGANGAAPREGDKVLRLEPRMALTLIGAASFFCCVTMAMPQGHLIALCSDLGFGPGIGAAMLSVLLGTAFVSRQIWGVISDRIGGLTTVLCASACQAAAMTALLLTQDETGLFVVSAFFGFGFSGIIPAYVLAIRELFPVTQAFTAVSAFMLLSGSGMAMGGWLAGALYDHFGFYGAAFAAGLGANVINLAIVGFLVVHGRGPAGRRRSVQLSNAT